MQPKSTNFPKSELAIVQKLLRDHPFEDIQTLIEVDIGDLLPKAETTLRHFRKKDVLPFDPYRISGYAPSENKISDALREILDPNGIRRFGLEGIRALLDAVKATAEDTAEQMIISKVKRIENSLNDPSVVRVKREVSFEDGRFDILIDDPKSFLIIIENKNIWDPSEVGKTAQTLRYEMLRSAEDKGHCALGIYLTPSQKLAQSKHFFAISCAQFSGCLRKRFSSQNIVLDEDTRTLLLAFTLTYAWMH